MTAPNLRVLTAEPDTSSLRTETWRGNEYLVVPVIPLVEGVYQCATCPTAELYLASEFGAVPEAWNGRPVTLQHPQVDGVFVSANSRGVLDAYQVGTMFNASLDGQKLKAELWIDLARVAEVGPDAQAAVDALQNGDPVEVSTGYWSALEPAQGTMNGREYQGIQRGVKPDHIALLPGMVGACSWQDGCGAPRTNQGGAHEVSQNRNLFQRIRDALSGNAAGVSDGETRTAIYNALDALGLWASWITDVFPDDQTFVYELEGNLWMRSYEIGTDGKATLGDATQVKRTVSYDPVPAMNAADEPAQAAPEPAQPAPDPEPTPNAQPCGCSEETSMTENEPAATEPQATPAPEAAPKPTDAPQEAPTPNAAPTLDEAFARLEADLGPDIAGTIKAAHKRAQEHRADLVKRITANETMGFTPEDLSVLSDEHLEKLARASTPVDYSAAQPPRANTQTDDTQAPPAPPVVLARPAAAGEGKN